MAFTPGQFLRVSIHYPVTYFVGPFRSRVLCEKARVHSVSLMSGTLSSAGKNKHVFVRRKGGGSNGPHGKIAVIGAISRKGNVVAQIIEKVNAETLQGFVRQTVADNVSLVATDEHTGCKGLSKVGYPHESVSHNKGEYVRGNVHTANLDSFWSLLKRASMKCQPRNVQLRLPMEDNPFPKRNRFPYTR